MIAISYRREDSLPITGRLYDRLEARFGKEKVFMDFDSIRPGLDFRQQIKETIERSKVVVAVIGPNWLGQQSDGSRRIDDPMDFVRLEIEYALKREIPIIPVLINDTPMPKAEQLPSLIDGLAFRHALPLDTGLDFRQHAERLISTLSDFVEETTPAAVDRRSDKWSQSRIGLDVNRTSSRARYAIIFGLVAAAGIAAAWILRNNPQTAPTQELSRPASSDQRDVTTSPPTDLNTPVIVERTPSIRESAPPEPRRALAETNRSTESETPKPAETARILQPTISVPPQNTDVFTGTWEGTYTIENAIDDGTPARGPFPIRMVISGGRHVSKTPPSECEKWVGSGPGILACFGRSKFESLTVDPDGETATYFMQADYTNINGTLRKVR